MSTFDLSLKYTDFTTSLHRIRFLIFRIKFLSIYVVYVCISKYYFNITNIKLSFGQLIYYGGNKHD